MTNKEMMEKLLNETDFSSDTKNQMRLYFKMLKKDLGLEIADYKDLIPGTPFNPDKIYIQGYITRLTELTDSDDMRWLILDDAIKYKKSYLSDKMYPEQYQELKDQTRKALEQYVKFNYVEGPVDIDKEVERIMSFGKTFQEIDDYYEEKLERKYDPEYRYYKKKGINIYEEEF